MKQDFRPMSIDTVLSIISETQIKVDELIVRDGFAINLNLSRSIATQSLLDRIMLPYIVKDYRILRILSGSGRIEINFTEHELVAGDIVLLKEGSYFQVLDVSDDMKGEVIAVFPKAFASDLPFVTKNLLKIHPDKEGWEEIDHLFYSIYIFAAREPFRKEVVWHLIEALVNNMVALSHLETRQVTTSRSENIYSRFIEELSANRTGKHPVRHYADLLFITPQYLSKIVSEVSGKTVTDWINKAVIHEARILLRDPSKTISEIAETLNFPNDSFFCRFFKRETKQTPTQYRRTASEF